MYTIVKIIRCFFVSVVLACVGCATSVPIFERKVSDSVIREDMIADYDLNSSRLVMSDDYENSKIDARKIRDFLSSLVESFSSSLDIKSKKIKKITFDKEFQYIRIELNNCEFFVVNFELVKNNFTVIDSGMMGPCY